MIFISNKFFNFIGKNNGLKNYLKENNIVHYLFTCDVVEYNFKDVYKTFNISYFSKSADLISNQFAVSQNLKDYETIEEITNKSITILIKKFKIRVSFKKSNKFSNQIIICDDYNFNPMELNHFDSLIKIAIVKDNYDKWINSNLNHYDYIFASEKISNYSNDNVDFILKGKTIYEQIKHVLNELYRKKTEKFHYFIKNVEFQNVFPKEGKYFKVLNSEFFDDDWYRNTYKLENNTDSVIHFLLVGYAKGYNPSPNFSTFEYYECNKDVKKAGRNPLVHYELYGRDEGRFIWISDKLKRDYDLILNSPCFDGDWYRSTYDLDDDVDCVDHYLRVGYTLGFNPGPDFSTYEYYECNMDVKEDNENPLVHYEVFGRIEKRNINLSKEDYNVLYSSILNSPYFDGDWYRSTYDLDGDVDCVNHYLKIGLFRSFNPGPDFSTYEYYECNKDVKKTEMNPLVHYELYGRGEGRFIWISDKLKRDYDLILNSPCFDGDWYRSTYDLDGDVDCVDHYLRVGYTLGFNPGPDFSTYEYYECNMDVKEDNENPLVHYEIFGRNERRPIKISVENNEMFYSSILNSPYFDKGWYKSTYNIGDWDAVEHYMKIGYARGFNPGPDFSTNDYYECNPDIKEYGMNALVHYEIYGRAEGRKLKKSD